MNINVVLSDRKARLLEYALNTLMINFDEMAEEDLETGFVEGEQEVRSLMTELGFEVETPLVSDEPDFGPPIEEENDYLAARLKFVETGG